MGIEIRTRGSSNVAETIAEFETLNARLNNAMTSAGEEGTDHIHDAATAAIRKRTGRTATQIKKVVTITGPGSGEGEVYITDPVGSYLHHGTGIHGPEKRRYTITPVKKRALKIPGSRTGFASRVNHPGMRGDQWMRTGAEAAEVRVLAGFNRHVERALGV